MFSRKRQKSYDKQNQKPAIKASICNGEVVAGFIDLTNWQSLIWREQLSKDSCSFSMPFWQQLFKIQRR